MGLLERLRKGLRMIGPSRRDPAVAKQITQAAVDVRESGRLFREIRGLQGELERTRPSKHRGDATWDSNSPSSH